MKRPSFKNICSNLLAAFVIGVINLTYTISFAALVFNGVLAEYIQAGISVILVSYAISSFVMAAGSSLRGLIVTPKGAISAIISVIASAIIANRLVVVDGETALASLLACLMISTFTSGVFFLFLGVFRLGNLIRFIPFPVTAGYFGGVGLLLINGSIAIMTDMSFSLIHLYRFIEHNYVIRWAPGLFFALVCLILTRRFKHYLMVPLLMVCGFFIFFSATGSLGISTGQLRDSGLLMPTLYSGISLPKFFPDFLQQVHWTVVVDQWGNIFSIVLVGSISILLYISVTEVGTGREISLERDLKAAGLANILTSLIGGFVSFHEPVDTKLAYQLGGKSRMVGVLFGILCLLFIPSGGYIISYFPKPIMGGLLLYIGVNLFLENIRSSWRQLPKSEFGLVVLIIVSVALFGFIEGVGVGILVAIILFVINYSRMAVIKSNLSGRIYHSKVERSTPEQDVLRRYGDQLQIFILQGYIFFGTAERLLIKIRNSVGHRLADPSRRVSVIVLDFRLVQDIDSSALNAFAKLLTTAVDKDLRLVFSDLNPKIKSQFEAAAYFDGHHAICFDHLDFGLEWCEEQILRSKVLPTRQYLDIEMLLTDILQHPDMVPNFKSFLDVVSLDKNEVLFQKDDPSDCLYFIESGRISVLLQKSVGRIHRFRTLGAGTVMGEIGMYTEQPRTARAVADEESTLYALSYDRFMKIEEKFPDIARQFHKFIVRSLSTRMVQDSEALQVLLI